MTNLRLPSILQVWRMGFLFTDPTKLSRMQGPTGAGRLLEFARIDYFFGPNTEVTTVAEWCSWVSPYPLTRRSRRDRLRRGGMKGSSRALRSGAWTPRAGVDARPTPGPGSSCGL